MRILTFLSIIFFLAACKKSEDRKCFKSTGDDTEFEILLDDFHELNLNEKLAYILVHDTINKVIVKGGENLINFVKLDVNDGVLTVSNENKCNFLRTYKKIIEVEIHCKDINKITYNGTETLRNLDTLKFNVIDLLIRDGAGPVDLTIDNDMIKADVTHGWGDFTLHGKTNYARLEVKSNGYCDAYDLKSNKLTVISNTPAISKVNADQAIFTVQIEGSGDVWYKGNSNGNPVIYQYGTGELIQK